MFIRCPACQTLFRIQPKQLKAARGQVRCGSCQAVFDGLEFLVNREELTREELAALGKPNETAASHQWQLPFDDVPSTPEPSLQAEAKVEPPAVPEHAPHGEEPEVIEADTQVAEAIVSVETEPSARAPADPVEERAPTLATSEPDEAETESEPPAPEKPVQPFKWSPRYTLHGDEPNAPPPRLANRLGWGFGSLLLIMALAGQLAWFNRSTLALDPRWRPWLQGVCDVAGCQLPPQRDPHAIEMVDRNVQSHPQYQGALLITATLVNQAPFAQPYPQVELSMTDLDQKRVAARRFLPSEYLDNGHPQGLIPPGASARLKLEIADPGQEAVGFEFEFY